MAAISSNTTKHQAVVTRRQRQQINQHRSVILWFTGLSGAGKSTLAHEVEKQLYQSGCRTFVLDGDNIRQGLCGDLGFSVADRRENIRRIAEVAHLMLEAGIITLTAFISPFIAERQLARKLVAPEDFIEIYCKCDITVCEQRDVKGLYEKARHGEILQFTGISSPYEPPINPELVIDTGNLSLESSVSQVLSYLENREILTRK
jgi:adenylylsulfate kinase